MHAQTIVMRGASWNSPIFSTTPPDHFFQQLAYHCTMCKYYPNGLMGALIASERLTRRNSFPGDTSAKLISEVVRAIAQSSTRLPISASWAAGPIHCQLRLLCFGSTRSDVGMGYAIAWVRCAKVQAKNSHSCFYAAGGWLMTVIPRGLGEDAAVSRERSKLDAGKLAE